jgi:hypothetical protein
MNGLECLKEMQKKQRLKNLPVIIYHIRKADLSDLKKALTPYPYSFN